ncbi:MAG: PhoPQ-activated protein PqaA family protein [Candidatus Hydrogenedentales bacterium]|jgi:PhoPQ-activated pathogenicity-related protein/PKD repeat protein
MSKAHYIKHAILLVAVIVVLAGCQETVLKPAPQFSVNRNTGDAPLKVLFEDTSDGGIAGIYSWNWSFGDGGTSNERSPEYVYKVPGVYTVTLEITTGVGNFRVVKEGLITVTEANDIAVQVENTFVKHDVAVELPAGYSAPILFGIAKDAAPMNLGANQAAKMLSSVFTIRHNQDSPDLFMVDAQGVPTAAQISIPLLNPLDLNAADQKELQLLAQFKDGHVVPIPGKFVNNKFTVSVLRLPQRANYVVVQRPAMSVSQVNTKETGLPLIENPDYGQWTDVFQLYWEQETEQQLSALYRGKMDTESTFTRRNYSASVVADSKKKFADAIKDARKELTEAGIAAPLLVNEDDLSTINFYNMYKDYPVDFVRATDRPHYDLFFGHIVYDTAQLLAVARRNLRVAMVDEDALDFTEYYHPESALFELLIQSTYPRYGIPSITTRGDTIFGLPVPADRNESDEVKVLSFLQGFQDGLALYFGQRNAAYRGRGFGNNEHGLLSFSALFPYSPYVPGYSYATHEVLAWLDGNNVEQDPLVLFADCLGRLKQALQQKNRFYTRPLYYREALTVVYETMDKVLHENNSTGYTDFASLYWDFVRDTAYENGWNSIIRPSDTLRPPYTLNEDRFAPDAVVTVVCENAADIIKVSSKTYPALAKIEPMSARAIVVELNPMTTTAEFSPDPAMLYAPNMPQITVYRDGQAGSTMCNYEGSMNDVLIQGLGCLDSDCTNKVILLVANLDYEKTVDIDFSITTQAEISDSDENLLARYLSIVDSKYNYRLESTQNFITEYGCIVYVLKMTSGSWRNVEEAEPNVWQHRLFIIEPANVRENSCLLYLTSLNSDDLILDSDGMELLGKLGAVAVSSRSVTALLADIPNQPIEFFDQPGELIEDKLIAYSFDKFMNSYNSGSRDATWPVLLPMTRAAVRAMDTVQDFVATKRGQIRDINNFVVSGTAKIGWAAWLTAAMDERVSALISIAADFVNLDAQMKHQRNAYSSYKKNSAVDRITGGYSNSLADYVGYDIFDRFDSPAGASLLRIVDPYSYRNLLTMPKLLVNSAGDSNFLPDSTRFFINDMQGPTILHVMPNTDYSQIMNLDLEEDSLETIAAFYYDQIKDAATPDVNITYNDVTREITLDTFGASTSVAGSVTFWYANAPNHRDFRLDTFGSKWKQEVLTAENGVYKATIPLESGYNAGFIQARFQSAEAELDYFFSSQIWVTPDTYPEID